MSPVARDVRLKPHWGKADAARPRPVLARAFELVGEWDEQEAE
jgi:hypothetical protein